MISETVLINRSGQDIEYRVSGGGNMTAVGWAPLPGGATQPIAPAEPPYAIELRLGKISLGEQTGAAPDRPARRQRPPSRGRKRAAR